MNSGNRDKQMNSGNMSYRWIWHAGQLS
jgi:hypothetical protein